MSAEDASKTINKAFLAENPDGYATLQVDEDALCDVLSKGEAKLMQTRERYVGKYFKAGPAPKYTTAQKKAPRWLPSQDTATTEVITNWISKYAPPDVEIQCDDYNGRWRVIAPTLDWKSVSWTKRGYEKAALEVIHQAWEYQRDWCGAVAPFSLVDLAKRFQENE
jgi:hypothetical protein